MSNRRKTAKMNTGEKRRMRESAAAAAALSLILLVGSFGVLEPLYDSALCGGAAILTGTATLLLLCLTSGSKRAEKRVKIGLYLACILVFVLFVNPLLQGFLALADRMVVLWNGRFGTELERLAVGNSAGFGSLILWGLAAIPASCGLFYGIRRQRPGIPVCISVAALGAGLVLGQRDAVFYVTFLLAGIFGMFIYMSAPEREGGVRFTGGMLAVVLLILGVTRLSGFYERQSGLESWKAAVADTFEMLRYGKDTLPEGDLTKRAGLLEGDTVRLILESDAPEELYLRGFVGSVYTGDAWKKLPVSSYEKDYQGLFSWLDAQNFSPVREYADYEKLTAASENQPLYTTSVQVNNRNASRKYLYVPAAAELETRRAKVKNDGAVRAAGPFGTSAYQMTLINDAPSAENVTQADWLGKPTEEAQSSYLDAEAVYRSFVDSVYLDVDTELETRLNTLFFEDTDPAELTLDELTTQIRQVLRSRTTYAKSPEAIPEGRDAVSWFLWEDGSGNAVDYASAAVLAYRVAGWPARYAEGYHLSETEAAAAQESGENAIELTTQNAHAWVEIYVAGMGWLPVEVVPGMYTETYTSEQVEGQPTYRVHASQDENGMTAESGGRNEQEGEQPDEKKHTATLRSVFAVVLVILYLGFGLFLLLELQRALRKAWRRRRMRQLYTDGMTAEAYVERGEKLMGLMGVRGDLAHPDEVSQELYGDVSGIERRSYERAVELARKARFGGKELTKAELYVMACYQDNLETRLMENSGYFRRMVLRYVYVIK